MKLYIAEKPSLGRAIADVLPGGKRGDGFIKLSNGDVVSWCVGHLLVQAEPHKYDAAFKSWKIQHLPIIPVEWKLEPRKECKAQIAVLRKLVKEADQIVHAGDPDREGQLLVDEVINYLKVSKSKRDNIQRLLINDLNPDAVKRALNHLEKNTKYYPLSISALARSRADWLYGINMTRAYTIQGRKSGHDGVLSVGRVQTPVLGIVARRCEDIENFKSKPFYEVTAEIATDTDQTMKAKWKPGECSESYLDDAGRVLDKNYAESIVVGVRGSQGVVTKYETKEKQRAQPLGFSLSVLQIEAAKKYGMSAQSVLKACQSLYETHKVLTYPRSDCRYLPEGHFKDAHSILEAIAENEARWIGMSHEARKYLRWSEVDTDNGEMYDQPMAKSPIWNDKKVTAHHAIVPTQKRLSGELTVDERNVYWLVARQYIAQFFPVHEYGDTSVEILIEDHCFARKVRGTRIPGWTELFESDIDLEKEKTEIGEGDVPVLRTGQTMRCKHSELVEKMTSPPAYFTDATLLAAMTGISRYVSSPDIRKVLKDTDGLGTEATRAGIIELLFNRKYLERKGKKIHVTSTGKKLIRALPVEATLPDMTAHWESTLTDISNNDAKYEEFMEPLKKKLTTMIQSSIATEPA